MRKPSVLNLASLLPSRVEVIAKGPQPGEETYVPSPWRGMNEKIGGWLVGVQTLLLMHSGDGKSSVLRSAALAAARGGVPSLLISTEDPAPYTQDRFLAELTGLATQGLSRLQASPSEVMQLRRAHKAKELGLIDVHFGGLTATETVDLIHGWATEKRKETDGPLWVGLDYFQTLVIGSDNTEGDLALLSQQLNDLAGESRISLIAASQVRSEAINDSKRRLTGMKPPTRAPSNWLEFAEVFRPGPADAEFCRRLEKSSKVVISGLRPGKFARLPPLNWDVPDEVVTLTFLKNNFGGGTGLTQTLRWDADTQTVQEFS